MKFFTKQAQLVATFLFLGLFTTQANNFDDVFSVYNNDLQVINASVLHPTSGKAHFFVGQFFHQYNPVSDKLDKMGVIGKDGWYGVTKNLDAVLIHPQNKKAYFFTGNTYQRYDFIKKRVDKTGVTGQDGWNGLAGPFDAVIMHPTNNKAYFFKGKRYYRFSFEKNKMDKVGTIGVDGWKGLPANIDSAIMHPNGKAYFFAGDKYYRYVFGRSVDKNGIIGRDGWKGLFHKIDGVVENKDDFHFFRGAHGMNIKSYNENYTVRQILDKLPASRNILGDNIKGIALTLYPNSDRVYKMRLGYDWYKGVPKDIDASLQHPITKKYYFFKGSKYYRYDPSSRSVDETDYIGRGAWRGLSKNVDAAIAIKDHIYLFKDTKYYKYNASSLNRVIETGNISDKFKNVPNYIDAAHIYENKKYKWIKIMFFKKDIIYTYSLSDRRVVNWEMAHQNLFK
ncbi:hypothetical protein BFR04_06550 [Gaetbulibacter sp. 4G1]|nr:hemopexin repeat-containing protein [Gaetbulibacter sp. 4G1]PIA79175.1 hypothetical protein BFR04_06550 [Gaetbulibacter sp. 4G1]